MKVLNLYAGSGGNRKLWEDVGVTAIENNKEIAKIYQDFFPNDKVIVTDAHKYLLEYYKEFDFIWSSPPCPTHSRVRFMGTKAPHPTCGTIIEKKYPDMNLYQEIILLKSWYDGKFCIENVIGYYSPLIPPIQTRGHYFWTNFHIRDVGEITRGIRSDQEPIASKYFSIDKYKINKAQGRQILNNCVEPELGLHILTESKIEFQQTLFGSK